MYSNVVYQFVFCFERFALTGALLPEANVVALLRTTDVLHRDVRDQLMHGAESFVASLLGVAELLLVDPFTDELLFNTLLSHVSKECTRVVVVVGHVHPHVHIHRAVLVVELRCGVGIGSRAGDLVILVGAPENFPR